MGTTHHRWLGTQELLAMGSFLVTVLLGAWLLPGAWLSGAVVGLGIGLTVAAAVHLHAVRVALPALMGRSDDRRVLDEASRARAGAAVGVVDPAVGGLGGATRESRQARRSA